MSRVYWLAIAFAGVLVCGGMLGGCATSGTLPGATTAQKMSADVVAVAKVANDVKANCGPQFAPLSPLIVAALAVATDPYNAVADIAAALQVIPALVQDYKAFACIVTTIRDDYNALKPKPAPGPVTAVGSAAISLP